MFYYTQGAIFDLFSSVNLQQAGRSKGDEVQGTVLNAGLAPTLKMSLAIVSPMTAKF